MTEWMVDALCRQFDPETFYPEEHAGASEAKKICGKCPVQAECLLYGLNDPHGIYAGVTARERRRLRHRQPRPEPAAVACGTASGYRRHRKRAETACAECVEAWRLQAAALAAARRAARLNATQGEWSA